MLIALSGASCSGKDTLIEYLVSHHGFTHLRLPPPYHSANKQLYNESDDLTADLCFATAEKALEYILKHDWKSQHYVLSPIESVIDAITLKRRPFALLVSIEVRLIAFCILCYVVMRPLVCIRKSVSDCQQE